MIVCGHAYGFRATYVPLLRSLNDLLAVEACVVNYPEGYDIEPMFADLRRDGVIESGMVVPNERHRWRHHRAAAAMAAALRRTPIDVLLVDTDFTPLQQYLIGAARTRGTAVVGIPKEGLTSFLGRYHIDAGIPAASSGRAGAPRSGGSRFRRVIGRVARGPQRLATAGQVVRYLNGTAAYAVERTVNNRLFPWLFTGQVFPRRSPGFEFVSTGADLALVYSDVTRRALRHYLPDLDVRVVEDPRAANCRCDGARRTKLLVALGGPWYYYIRGDNPAEAIERRWSDAIRRAVALTGVTSVDIRPHPRETDAHPRRLAERLVRQGVAATVVDSTQSALGEIVCDYVGVLGAPSGALGEAAASCRRVFVAGLRGVEGEFIDTPLSYFSEAIRDADATDLTAADFVRPTLEVQARPTVGRVLEEWLEGPPRPGRCFD